MTEPIKAYPLQWPVGWKRTKHDARAYGRFSTQNTKAYRWSGDFSIAQGVGRIVDVLAKMGVERDDVVISSNVPTRLDGLPRSGAKEPDDPGVAVYWREKNGQTRCMAIDRYTRCAQNLAAVAATLDAMRAIERHGGAEILDRAFTGFTALPAPGADKPWRDVLGPCTTLDEARQAYRRAARIAHPDHGGSESQMAELNRAWEQAQEALT